MDDRDTIAACLHEAGFDETLVSDPGATIRAPISEATTVIGSLPMLTLEDGLPHISVDLPGTLPTLPGEPREGLRRSDPAARARPELEIQGVLGEGGMGRVFVARQRSLDREVAIKTLRDRAAPNDHRALIAEGAVTGHLEHPAIIPVHALGVHADGRPVLVMKRVDGVAWRDLFRDPSHAAWEGWGGDVDDRLDGHLEILMHICNAAHYAHSRGIVHLDIKPQNVLIGRFGDAYLADFGIARRISEGGAHRICGTPAYMAPEMALGDPVDVRTDVYLLGATLHEILTGKPRHVGDHVAQIMFDAVASPPVDYPPSVPADLAALANRATARDPAHRPASAAELRNGLAAHLRHKSSLALAASAAERVARLSSAGAADDGGDVELIIAEARFALTQALEQWPENPTAKRAQGELEAILATRRARAAELEAMAREQDPSVSAKQRTYTFGVMMAVVAAMLATVVGRGVRHIPDPAWLVRVSFIPFAVLAPFTLVFRRHLAASAINRQTAYLLWTGAAGICISRLLALRAGTTGPAMLVQDSMLCAALGAFGAATLPRWIWFSASFFVGSAVVGTLAPDLAHFALNAAVAGALLLGVLFGRAQMKR